MEKLKRLSTIEEEHEIVLLRAPSENEQDHNAIVPENIETSASGFDTDGGQTEQLNAEELLFTCESKP